MNHDLRQNYEEKLRLVVLGLLEALDNNIKVMLADHSRDGKLGSGDTIRKTMDFILDGNSELYRETINHVKTLNLAFEESIEPAIQNLVKVAQELYKNEAFIRLKKSTEIARNPKLYERMVDEVEKSMANDLANFHNSLNSLLLDLRNR